MLFMTFCACFLNLRCGAARKTQAEGYGQDAQITKAHKGAEEAARYPRPIKDCNFLPSWAVWHFSEWI